MANKHKIHRAARDRVVEDLKELRKTGQLTKTAFRIAADESGYSIRHLQRLLATPQKGDARSKPQFEVDEAVIQAVYLACGSITGARRLLGKDERFAAHHDIPSLSTFRRRVVETVGSHGLAVAKRGTVAAREVRVHLPGEEYERGETYLLDHTELPIYVVPEGMRTASRPWLTAVMDAGSRYIVGWVLTTGRVPDAEQVRAALMAAIDLRLAPDGQTTVGGAPERCHWDRGLDFLSELITESCVRLGITPVALPAYSPHLKGRLERFWATLKPDALGHLPGYIDSGRNVRGEYLFATNALPEAALLNELRQWIDWYNAERQNRSLGLTPLAAWQQGRAPLRAIPRDRLWQDFLLSSNHKVGKNGVHLDKHDFVGLDSTLNDLIGRTVEVRYLPHNRDFVEVFEGGQHRVTCYNVKLLRASDKTEFIKKRREAQHRTALQFSAARRARAAHPGALALEEIRVNGRKKVRVVTEQQVDLLDGITTSIGELNGRDQHGQSTLW